ncbi:glycosyltransferase [Vibrio parahaemolyticus]|uniref:glycosyltransferase n=1 Tax=Vibrio parahaemolyticus TaxID=670 RepID=UPI00084AA7FA|nr:glycosyltransferase [Vibrio parahaemolyticus]MBE4321329.1 glycosyltransferase family 4 protein [Vibrio parahaemolyticus]MBE4339978.1 glycosyltransferase family 4 protein [Vibrio parahaemolyticus]ODZ91304.1 hypothetical protein BBM50_09855 [Vibrio parahaemolyticus]ODZ97889.1 hypothetical protein BBM51_16875 [Vibrio parahaemolyticus]
MKNILVLCSGYPSKGNPYNCTWAHVRNRYYIKNGLSVEVFVIGQVGGYVIDGVKVISKEELNKSMMNNKYSLIISHSPNLRGHLPILKKNKIKTMLFMHGTESMWLSYDYPKPYFFEKQSLSKRLFRDAYDFLKFSVLKRYILSSDLVHVVFVSNWMKDIFEKNVMKISCESKYSIINNSLNENFFIKEHEFKVERKKADFVTLRRLDHSKFAIDMVCNFARTNPDYSFHIYGKGVFFDYMDKPKNIEVFDYHINQDEIPELLNDYPCALMPTRCDAQGVMACEIATYGMPLITTNISVNKEMFKDFSNVKLLSFDDFDKSINLLNLESIYTSEKRNLERFSFNNTLRKELDLILGML